MIVYVVVYHSVFKYSKCVVTMLLYTLFDLCESKLILHQEVRYACGQCFDCK